MDCDDLLHNKGKPKHPWAKRWRYSLIHITNYLIFSLTKKLHTKGAEVIYVQMPYEGHYAVSEIDIAPRELTWDVLLERTGALGLHFQDHEEMQGYWLPEWSHMTGEEADRFTEAFYDLVQRELAARETTGGNP